MRDVGRVLHDDADDALLFGPPVAQGRGRICSARAAVVRIGRRLVTWARPWISCNNFIMFIRVAIRNSRPVIASRVPRKGFREIALGSQREF